MPTTTIRLPAEMKERVAKVAAWSGKTSHALILDAITSRLDEEEYRNDFYITAEKRYDKITATGETVPWKEMRSYLEKRANGKEVNRPSPKKISS